MKTRFSHSPTSTSLLAVVVALASQFSSAAPPNGREDVSSQSSQGRNTGDVGGRVDKLISRFQPPRVNDPAADHRLALRAVEVASGKVSLLAMEPLPGHTYCGSPSWSLDGSKIAFDATPGTRFSQTRICLIDGESERAKIADLGNGNCPTWSPDGKQIAFLSNIADGDSPAGIWQMRSDGTERHSVSPLVGVPKWSPDGSKILVVSFGSPCRLTLVDLKQGTEQAIEVAGHRFYSMAAWAGDDASLIAVASWNGGSGVVLLDLTVPSQAKLRAVLWKKPGNLKLDPTYPVFRPAKGDTIFAGRSGQGTRLYRITALEAAPLPLDPEQAAAKKIASLALSPDGRFVLYCSDR